VKYVKESSYHRSDGSYLAEFSLSKGYEAHGLIRKSSTFNTFRIDHLSVDPHEQVVKLCLHYADISDDSRLTNLIYDIHPDGFKTLLSYTLEFEKDLIMQKMI